MSVRPRDAASLILLRSSTDGPEVLMGRRRPKAAFIPDAFVFPGGRVDQGDAQIAPLRLLSPPTETALIAKGGCSAARARAIATAAIRELHEETGLVLGTLAGAVLRPDHGRLGYLGRAITPAESPIRFHARFLIATADGGEGALGGSGELLDLGWFPIAAALALPIIDVTEFMLREVAAGSPDARGPRHPLYTYRGARPFLRYL